MFCVEGDVAVQPYVWHYEKASSLHEDKEFFYQNNYHLSNNPGQFSLV
jgi:hypothetical protein